MILSRINWNLATKGDAYEISRSRPIELRSEKVRHIIGKIPPLLIRTGTSSRTSCVPRRVDTEMIDTA